MSIVGNLFLFLFFLLALLLLALLLLLVLLVLLVLLLVLVLVLVLVVILLWFRILKDMPLDDWSSGILQSLLPMLEPRLVLFVLAPAQLYLSNGISTANQIVVANRDVQSNSLHVHFLDDKYK